MEITENKTLDADADAEFAIAVATRLADTDAEFAISVAIRLADRATSSACDAFMAASTSYSEATKSAAAFKDAVRADPASVINKKISGNAAITARIASEKAVAAAKAAVLAALSVDVVHTAVAKKTKGESNVQA